MLLLLLPLRLLLLLLLEHHELLVLQERHVLLLQHFHLGREYGILAFQLGLFAIHLRDRLLKLREQKLAALSTLEGVHTIRFAARLQLDIVILILLLTIRSWVSLMRMCLLMLLLLLLSSRTSFSLSTLGGACTTLFGLRRCGVRARGRVLVDVLIPLGETLFCQTLLLL